MRDQLLAISVGVTPQRNLLLQSVWCADDRPSGRRRTDIEAIGDQTTLMCRLAELAGALFAPIGTEAAEDSLAPAA